ncbi:MAG: mannose-1-phosphate guanylyltransferase [Anaerolineales bacterium]|nr:mannose-1-phosphate guanylyltransferase [Anaerolineales bacterium]
MKASFYAVIMAGGGGTRLWPLSRSTTPKQTLRLFDNRSLFQAAVERLDPVISVENTFVVTVAAQADVLRPQAPQIPRENFILEPSPRGTASVVGLAAAILQAKDPDAVMAVLTADHFIGDGDHFRSLLTAAEMLAREGDLVTLGIRPDHPETGYGYIKQGKQRGRFGSFEAYSVETFKEKPTREIAEAYLASGGYIWNSGMFVWRTDRILSEIERQMPGLYFALKRIQLALGTEQASSVVAEEWETLVSETVDYGIMEGAENVSVIPAEQLGWLDVGGWGRFFDLYEKDANGNVVRASNTILKDVSNTLVFQSEDEDRLIAVLGVENLIVVDVGDTVFVCHRDQAERVKEIVSSLKAAGEVAFV